MAKLVSLVVKLGALYFVIGIPSDFAITLQLLGGIWMIQTLPAVLVGLYTRWLNSWGLLLGWAVGMVFGTTAVANAGFKLAPYVVSVFGITIPAYVAIDALLTNIVVAVLGTLLINMVSRPERRDATVAADYV